MSVMTPPAEPTADREQVRDERVRAVEQLVSDVEGWCKERDWPTRRIPKRITEEPLGGYEVPALVFQIDFLKFMFEPDARFAAETLGVGRLYRMPEYDTVATVYREPGGWMYAVTVPLAELPPDRRPDSPLGRYGELTGAFTVEAFLALVGRMSRHAD
ncbi:MAG: hypothetical protein K2X82_19315 [Gemmataceae bacterium]|nr:hypothetical protein [Gemmataceae bacterium]